MERYRFALIVTGDGPEASAKGVLREVISAAEGVVQTYIDDGAGPGDQPPEGTWTVEITSVDNFTGKTLSAI